MTTLSRKSPGPVAVRNGRLSPGRLAAPGRAALAATTASLLTLLGACAGTPPRADDVPAALAAGPQQKLAIRVAAKGVQIYECRAAAATTPAVAGQARYEWVFVAPEAELLDAGGRPAGTHGAGPHWAFPDGTRVTGRVKARADAPEAGAIPWLLLDTQPGSTQGRSAELRAVQRIHTHGGVAPASGCDATAAGTQLRVPYTADYLFYAGG